MRGGAAGRTRPLRGAAAASLLLVGGAAAEAHAQAPLRAPSEAPRISVSWSGAPIADVLLAFSEFSGKSIVVAPDVTGTVTATIRDQPWDVALQAILASLDLRAVEDEAGIIRVDPLEGLNALEAVEPIVTRVYPVRFTPAAELQATLAPLLSERGSVTVMASTNALVVSDVARIHEVIGRLLR